MKKYISFFRMRFIAGLQYRAAAAAGVATQFVWGAMSILMFKAFYEADAAAFPMNFQSLSTYIWLQQAFLAIFMSWILDSEIFQMITNGGIAYELCRPISLYNMWFFRTLADRFSRALLRCMPILIFACFLPKPYGLSIPVSISSAVWFIVSMALCSLVVASFCLIIYLTTFYTLSPVGVRIVAVCLEEFLSGAVIPIPFFPEGVRRVVEVLPFASMQNVPLRIYSGDIKGNDIILRVGLQLFWLITLFFIGRWMTARALRRVVVQGG